MASGYIEIHIKCPYYRCTDANRIRCEGAFPKTACITTFKDKAEMAAVIKTFCCDNFEVCPVYQAANKKYEKEE